MAPSSSLLVVCNKKTAAVVARYPEDPWVPEDHLALWFGELDPNGHALVWTVPSDCCRELERPIQVHH